jgi:hypothetical protein
MKIYSPTNAKAKPIKVKLGKEELTKEIIGAYARHSKPRPVRLVKIERKKGR